MKKLLGILVLGLLLIIFSDTAQAGCTLAELKNPNMKVKVVDGEWICVRKNLFDKAGDTLDDLNPLNYFEKRKERQADADRADTVAMGKRRYKDCMENPNDH